MEQTTNHTAAPLPGVFLGEESILYTTGKTSSAKALRMFFLCCHIYMMLGSKGLLPPIIPDCFALRALTILKT